MNWTDIDTVLGGALGNTIGSAILAGLILLFFFAGLIIRLGLSFDAAIVVITPVVWMAASPTSLGGVGWLPAWVFYVMLMLQAIITFAGIMRVFNR